MEDKQILEEVCNCLGIHGTVEDNPQAPLYKFHLFKYPVFGARLDEIDLQLIHKYLVKKDWDPLGIKNQEEAEGRAEATLRRNAYFYAGVFIISDLRRLNKK